MKFLLDMPVSPLLLDVLDVHGHEGVHAYQIGEGRSADIKLLELAREGKPGYYHGGLGFSTTIGS